MECFFLEQQFNLIENMIQDPTRVIMSFEFKVLKGPNFVKRDNFLLNFIESARMTEMLLFLHFGNVTFLKVRVNFLYILSHQT